MMCMDRERQEVWLCWGVLEKIFPSFCQGAVHIRTCSRVSGSRRAIRPPPTREAAARRMGTTLVIPTKEAKIVFPRMAPNLHNPLRMPNAVALQKKNTGENFEVLDLTSQAALGSDLVIRRGVAVSFLPRYKNNVFIFANIGNTE